MWKFIKEEACKSLYSSVVKSHQRQTAHHLEKSKRQQQQGQVTGKGSKSLKLIQKHISMISSGMDRTAEFSRRLGLTGDFEGDEKLSFF